MSKAKSVTIELTADQRRKIKEETGQEVTGLKFDALEDRIAPSIIGRMRKLDPPPAS